MKKLKENIRYDDIPAIKRRNDYVSPPQKGTAPLPEDPRVSINQIQSNEPQTTQSPESYKKVANSYIIKKADEFNSKPDSKKNFIQTCQQSINNYIQDRKNNNLEILNDHLIKIIDKVYNLTFEQFL